MHIFLAGIMQGSHVVATMHDQDYRTRLKRLLAEHWPEATVYDPLADHPSSFDYSRETARAVFMKHNAMCGETDLLIAFVPEATMGTAIEMWEAARHGRVVVTLSPLDLNWAVQFCSDLVYASVEAFEQDLASGQLRTTVEKLRAEKSQRQEPTK
jgi:nucleoside 2-deoxyribosyltransferase